MRRPSVPALRELRGKRTLADVATVTGFSGGHISNVERGIGRAGKRFVAALARAYRLTDEDLRRSCERTYRSVRRAS